jgi:two-component system LytT family sensor kinase
MNDIIYTNAVGNYIKRHFCLILQYHPCKHLTVLPRRVLKHTLAWCALILYEVKISLVLKSSATIATYAFYYILEICIFYFHANYVMSRFPIREWKIRSWFLLIYPTLLEIIGYVTISLLFMLWHRGISLNEFDKIETITVLILIWRICCIICVSTAYRLVKSEIASLKSRAVLEANLLRTENAYLRAQINPHLLFNTLNFIYFSVQVDTEKAAEAIALLSGIMQYAVEQTGEDGKVPLSLELEQIRKYIRLNQLRKEGKIPITAMISEDCNESLRIPPLILLTFIENLFKHGDLHQPCSIDITCTGNTLRFQTKNRKKIKLRLPQSNIGMQNAATRLKSYYKEDKHQLAIHEDDTYYTLKLTIHL